MIPAFLLGGSGGHREQRILHDGVAFDLGERPRPTVEGVDA